MTNEGNLLVFEGADGTGKTTLSKRLAQHLSNHGVKTQWMAFPGHQPGTLGRHIYDLHHNPEASGLNQIPPASLQILHIAAHVEQIELTILPALRNGITIVLDRYWWSTWVYGIASGVSQDALKSMIDLELLFWGGLRPQIVFLVQHRESLKANPAKNWAHLCHEYACLAEREQASYTVARVNNDEAPENVIGKQILSHPALGEILNLLP